MKFHVTRHTLNRQRKLLFTVSIYWLIWLFFSGCQPLQIPKVYKIGLVAPFEGAYRAYGYDAIYAARMAIREINASSVPEGWALELVAFDDRAEVDMAQSAARNLVIDPDVLAVIGHYTGETTTAVSSIYNAASLAVLVIGDGPVSPTYWHIAPSPQSLAGKILTITESPPTSIAIWGDGLLVSELSRQFESQSTTLVSVDLQERTTEFPELVISTLPAMQTAEGILSWSERGWQGNLIGTRSLHTLGYVRSNDTQQNQICYITPYPLPADVPDSASWTTGYTQTGPHVPEPGPFALPTYETIYVLAEIIAQQHLDKNPLTRQGINIALRGAYHNGKLGEISWNKNGYWENAPLYLYCWEDIPQLRQILP